MPGYKSIDITKECHQRTAEDGLASFVSMGSLATRLFLPNEARNQGGTRDEE
jgi:hypothetical protein